jgi:hypothetical protein
VIIRIQGEGQFRVADSELEEINRLDAVLERALAGGDDGFPEALAALLAEVRTAGTEVADDELIESDVILPAADASAEELRGMLGDDGLVPG